MEDVGYHDSLSHPTKPHAGSPAEEQDDSAMASILDQSSVWGRVIF